MVLLFVLLLLLWPCPPTAEATLSDPPLQKEVAAAQEALKSFDANLPLSTRKILKETTQGEKFSLTPKLRRLLTERHCLKKTLLTAQKKLELQRALLSLASGLREEKRLLKESDLIARKTVDTLDQLRTRYRMIRPAVMHNMLVNLRVKKEGLCWHWTRDLRKGLQELGLVHYELHWVTAHEGKLREHNSLVVCPAGRPFGEGILIDGWRRAGIPYWTFPFKDRYPWKEGEFAGNE